MKILLVLIAALLIASPVLAQEEDASVQEVPKEKALGQAGMAFEGRQFLGEVVTDAARPSKWVWGTVEDIDPQGGALVIRHLIYETSEEALKTVDVDDKTVFLGVAGLAEMEAGMNVTIDYKDKDGRWVADVIEVEAGGTP